jgi:hypothetical protein
VPPSDKTSDISGVFLHRGHTAARYGGRISGIGWLLLVCWIMWTQPERLGPTRMIGVIALGSITAMCTVLWCVFALELKTRLDATVNTAADTTGAVGRLHHIADTPRR